MRSRSDSAGFLHGTIPLACVLLLLQGAAAGARPYAPGSFWSANERVNDDSATFLQDRPDIALDGAGNAYAVWRDLRNGTYDGHWDLDVYFSFRPAGGDWSANQRVNDDAGIEVQDWPALAVTGAGDAYALWKDYRDGDPNIYVSYRPAGGTWSANERADDGGVTDVDDPDIAVDPAGNLYAVWQDWRNGDPDVYFGYRAAGGGWGANERISDAPADTIQYSGAIAVDGAGNAYAVWTDKRSGNADIYFSYRPQGGSWSANQRVNDDVGATEQWGPAIAADSTGNAYAVWQDNRNGDYDIYYSYHPKGGGWGTNTRVNDDSGSGHQYQAAIAVDGSTIFAIWRDQRSGDPDVYFSYRLTGGAWHPNERVNDTTGTAAQHDPVVAVDAQGTVYGAWADARNGDDDIYFSYRRATPNRVFVPIVLEKR
jgi:hypothetical protein